MKRRSIIALSVMLAGSFALSACATPTRYAPARQIGGTGYMQQPVGPGQWQVSFRGNGDTDRATVEDYLLFRAAELTLEQGFDGFVMLNADTLRQAEYRSYPSYGGGYYPGFAPYWGWNGRYGYSGWSPFYGGGSFYGPYANNCELIESFESYAVIGLYRGFVGGPGHFDARQVHATLRGRIRYP